MRLHVQGPGRGSTTPGPREVAATDDAPNGGNTSFYLRGAHRRDPLWRNGVSLITRRRA